MRLTDAAVRSFARHETFHPRYGWFRKAYSESARDPGIFGRDEAPVVIGVGKNMVRAIRFWGVAAKVITKSPQSPSRRAPQYVPTRRGTALFGDHGWDPFMEDPGTLWLLHWLLLAPPSDLPVWWLAFNEFNAVEFDDADLLEAVLAQLEAVPEWTAPHPSSIRKDIAALLRTYAPAEQSRRMSIDDVLDCPMRELGLLGRSAATGLYRFTLGAKPTLPSAVAVHAVLDYTARAVNGGRTVTLSRLAYEPGAPGRAFKLTETELLEALRPCIERTAGLSLAAPAGAWQFGFDGDPAELATTVLDDYYNTTAREVCSGCEGDVAVATLDIEPEVSRRGDAAARLNAAARVA